MRYFVKERFVGKGGDGDYVNLPYGTVCEMDDKGWLWLGNIKLAYRESENAEKHFILDEDGKGEERAKLIADIREKTKMKDPKPNPRFDQKKALEDPKKYGKFLHESKRQFEERKKYNDHVDERWDRITSDEKLQKYKKVPDTPEHWLWNADYYNAPIEDLKYIYELVKD